MVTNSFKVANLGTPSKFSENSLSLFFVKIELYTPPLSVYTNKDTGWIEYAISLSLSNMFLTM